MNFGGGGSDLAEKMDADSFRSKMNSIAYGSIMAKAAEDYKQELLASEGARQQRGSRQLDVGDLANDPDLEKLHRDRLAELQQEAEKRATLQQRGHGAYQDVKEADFLDAVTKSRQVVCSFYHRDFVRCKIADRHLEALAARHFDTRFVKVSAAEAPFFTEKLQIRVLPCVIVFVGGVAVERLVGFEAFGNRDDFKTAELEKWLVAAGGITAPASAPAALPEHVRSAVRVGGGARDSDDEDSDFSD